VIYDGDLSNSPVLNLKIAKSLGDYRSTLVNLRRLTRDISARADISCALTEAMDEGHGGFLLVN